MNRPSESIEILKQYKKIIQQLQEAQEEKAKLEIKLSEAKDKKRLLEKEQQIEEEHIIRIDEELESLKYNEIIKAKEKVQKYERGLQKLNRKKIFDFYDWAIILGVILWFAIIGFSIYGYFARIEFVLVAFLFSPILAHILTYILGPILFRQEEILQKRKQRKRQKLLEATKSLLKVRENNLDNQKRILELRAEKKETIEKINKIKKSDVDNLEIISKINEKINQLQRTIEQLSCEATIQAANYAVDLTPNITAKELSIDSIDQGFSKVKKIRPMLKGGKENE